MNIRKTHFSFGASLLSFVLISCTVMENSDITTLTEYNKLSLKSIEIKQETNTGNASTVAVLKFDSAQNLIDSNTGVHITRQKRYSLPSLANRKMRLRSGTVVNTEFYTLYKDDGLPYTFVILAGDSAVEIYRFRYNSANRLCTIITVLNPVDGKPAILRTNDTLVYETSGKLNSMTRRSPDASKAGSFALQFGSSGPNGSEQTLTAFNFLGSQFQLSSTPCHNNSSTNKCGQLQKQSAGPGPTVNRISEFLFGKTTEITITDQRINNQNCDCSREWDTYYLHPLMLLKDNFTDGDLLLWIYATDWWQPGKSLSNNQNIFTKDDKVQLNFTYAK